MPHNVIEQFLMDFSNLLWHYDFNETRISYFSFFPFLIFFLSFFFFNFKNFELQNFNDKILHCCTELYFTVLNSYTYLLFFFFFLIHIHIVLTSNTCSYLLIVYFIVISFEWRKEDGDAQNPKQRWIWSEWT